MEGGREEKGEGRRKKRRNLCIMMKPMSDGLMDTLTDRLADKQTDTLKDRLTKR